MHSAAANIADRIASAPARVPLERRRHKRVEIALLGRLMRANRQEYPAKLVDISVGGAAMMAGVEVDPGEHIVAYFDHIGGIEGRVARTFEGGFAIAISASQHKREKLAAQLTWLINRHEFPDHLERRHERHALDSLTASLRVGADVVAPASVRNVSISGALLTTEARPAIGTEAMLGKLRCRVVRHHADGVAVEFTDIQERDLLRRHLGRGQA